jgi:hypothetical protein
MDLRFVIVVLPVLIAASWAIFNIFAPAKKQADDLLNR